MNIKTARKDLTFPGSFTVTRPAAFPGEIMHSGYRSSTDCWIERTRTAHACDRFAELIYGFANPSNIGVNQSQEFYILPCELRHILLAVIAVVSDNQRLFHVESRKLGQSIFNRNDIGNIAGLFCKGRRLAPFN